MRAVSRQRAALNRRRREAEQALYELGPWCWRCGLTRVHLAGHERLGRAQGGNPERPDALLCHPCNTACEDEPIDAAWNGWKVSRKHPHDPTLGDDEAWDVHGNRVLFIDVTAGAA